MNTPPPLPQIFSPPPLPPQINTDAISELSYAKTVSMIGTAVITLGFIFGILDGGKELDLLVFAGVLAVVSWIGVIGLITKKKTMAWGAYVTFGVMLIAIPIGTVGGLFAFKWMKKASTLLK